MSDEVKPDLLTQTDSTASINDTEHDIEQHEVELGLNDHNNFDDDLKNDDFSATNNVNHSNNLVIKSEDIKQSEDSNDEVLVGSVVDDAGLYDDVMAEPTPNLSFSNEPSQQQQSNEDPKQHKTYTKRVSCYVGNLTWWTTDKDLSDIAQTIGVNDLVEIKFYENKINGQSKGFAMVTVGSDQSFRFLMDKLPKKQLNGQEPVVTHYSRHYFNQFEEQARKDMPATAASNEQQVFHHHNGNLNGSLNANNNQHSQPILQNRIRNNSFPAQSTTSSTSLNNGIIGGGQQQNTMSLNNNNRSLNNNINNNRPLQQQQTSLVGNYQANNNQIRMPSQQMGIMPNPALNNRQFNNNNQQMYNNNRPMLNQQTSLLGNRPPLLQTQPLLRPQLPLQQQQQPQMGLLNNPRMPINNMLPRQDWDNNRNYNNNSQTNGILPTNPMLLMNQQQQQQRNNLNNMPQQQSMPIPPNTSNTGSSQFGYNNNSLLPNNSILPPANQFQQLPQFSNMHNQQHLGNYNQMMNQNQLGMTQSHHLNHTNMTANQALIQQQQQQQHQHQQQSHHDLNHHPHHMPDQTYSYQRTNSGTSLIDQQIMPNLNHHLQSHLKLSEIEFQEALEKNRIVSGSALARAVQDASNGQYPSAIETLQTAISLIKQSKISQDERCKLLISSLQDTKKGIEDRYYNNGNSMLPNGTNNPGLIINNNRANSSGSRGDSRDRERLKRSRSRDSRSRDRDRDRDRSKRGGASDKHHRSSHRDRSRERRVNSGSSIVSNGAPSSGNDYYDEHSSSRYHHRSRH